MLSGSARVLVAIRLVHRSSRGKFIEENRALLPLGRRHRSNMSKRSKKMPSTYRHSCAEPTLFCREISFSMGFRMHPHLFILILNFFSMFPNMLLLSFRSACERDGRWHYIKLMQNIKQHFLILCVFWFTEFIMISRLVQQQRNKVKNITCELESSDGSRTHTHMAAACLMDVRRYRRFE